MYVFLKKTAKGHEESKAPYGHMRAARQYVYWILCAAPDRFQTEDPQPTPPLTPPTNTKFCLE